MMSSVSTPGLPLDFDTIGQVLRPQVLKDVSVLNLLLMLKADSLIYLLIAVYVNAVLPGKFGVGQSWYFPFQVLAQTCETVRTGSKSR